MNSLRKKYILAGSLLVLGFFVLLAFLTYTLKGVILERWNRGSMEELAQRIAGEIERKGDEITVEDLESLAFDHNVTIAVTDENLEILATTLYHEANIGKLGEKTSRILRNYREEIDAGEKSFFSDFDDQNKALLVQINKLEGGGYIVIRKSIMGLNNSIQIMEVCYFISALITIVIGIAVIVCLSGKMVRPIREINKVTRQISQKNFGERLPVNSRDELGTLAESVNLMSDALERDMDNLKKDVELRKNLVRNMAHELKTPVAVIMGYAENMPYIAESHPEKLEKYCSVISTECEHMDTMIRQMLEVSSYEYGEEVLQPELFTVQKLFQAIRKYLLSDFPDWQGTLEEENEVPGEICGDFAVLHRALYNYVKNAVRYGKENGLIRIRAWEEPERICFSVFNQGNPIPESEQEKIWNVFYKISIARTRESKSYGIGLSIVKQAALAHGGDAAVRNVDGGVEFSLYIKSDQKDTSS